MCSKGRGELSPQGTCLELLWSFLPSGRWLSDGTSAPRSGLWCARSPRNGKVWAGHFGVCVQSFVNADVLNEWMNQPKLWPYSHHSLDHLNELSACQLDSFRVSLDPNQATAFRVLGDPYQHFVLLLDPINCSEGEEKAGRDGWCDWTIKKNWIFKHSVPVFSPRSFEDQNTNPLWD